MRQRPKKAFVILSAAIIVVLIAIASDRLGLVEQSPNQIAGQVMVARYVLGRWPHDWEEVEVSIQRKKGEPPASLGKYDEIEIIVRSPVECEIVCRGRNALGFPSSQRKVLFWSDAVQREYEMEDKE